MEVFVDSNILLYYSLGSSPKIDALHKIFSNTEFNIHISTQAVNEFCNVVIRKKLLPVPALHDFIKMFERSYKVNNISSSTSISALKIQQRYKLSYYDSLIIAAGLEANCKILLSEDLHHGLLVEKKLKIVNPFKQAISEH